MLVRVFRYDPYRDVSERFENYMIPHSKAMSVLDVLLYIYDHHDRIAFRYGCRWGKCGTCAVMVNGRPVLACKTTAQDPMTVSPLPNFPIVRDLVVDRSGYDSKLARLRLFLERVERPQTAPEKLPPGQFTDFKRTSRCIDCLSCLATCPIVSQHPSKYIGPMAFLNLSRFAFDPRDRGEKIKTALFEGLYHCTMCEKCRQVCPLQLDIPQIAIEKLRGAAVRRDLGPPTTHREIRAQIMRTGRVVRKRKPSLLELTKGIFESPNSVARAGLFVGCLIDCDERLQDIGRDAIEVLAQNRMSVLLPRDQVCCGLPAGTVGYSNVIETLAHRNIESFGKLGADHLITLCAGCGMVLKKHYPKLAREKGRSLPEILDLAEVLTKDMTTSRYLGSRLEMRVAYSDPCHLYRGQSVFDQPRTLIKSIPGVELVEMEGSDICCGGGGGLRISNPELSLSIAEKKIDMALRANVDVIVTSCPTCILQLSDAARRKGHRIKVLHIASLLRMAYRGTAIEGERLA